MKNLWTREKRGWVIGIIAVPVFFWLLSQILPAVASRLHVKGYREVQRHPQAISGKLTVWEKEGKKRIWLKDLRPPLSRQTHPDLNREKFLLKFFGLLPVERAGLYWIGSESDDGSWIRIAGEEVVDNGGLHSRQEKMNLIHLTTGIHPVEVRFENQMGEAYLDLFWIPPDGVRRPLPLLAHPWGEISTLLTRLAFYAYKIAQYWTFMMLPLLLYPLLFPVRVSNGEDSGN